MFRICASLHHGLRLQASELSTANGNSRSTQSTPTQSSISWRHDYDAQGENLKYLKAHDANIHPVRDVTPHQLGEIVVRLTRPTTASIAAVWNFDNQDANLAHLKENDSCIELPYKTATPSSSSSRGRLSVEDFLPSSSRSPSPKRPLSNKSQRMTSFNTEVRGKKMMTSSTLPQIRVNGVKAKKSKHMSQRAYQYMANYEC